MSSVDETAGPSATTTMPSVTPVFMYPCFSGAPGMTKFKGKASAINLSEWKATLEMMFTVQYIPDTHRVDLVLSGLEGEAKREILILPAEQRQTARLIFDKLDELYGDRVPASVLRSLYFSCTQAAGETTRTFALRLQETFRRLQNKDPRGIGNVDVLLRDQFVDGLRDTTLRRELRTKMLLQEDLTFAQVKQEVLARVEVYGEEEIPTQAYVVQQNNPVQSNATRPLGQSHVPHHENRMIAELQQMRQELRKEMMSEFRDQFTSLSRELIQEVREHRQNAPREPDYERRTAQPPHPAPRRHDYGEQGPQGYENSHDRPQQRRGEYNDSRPNHGNGRWQRSQNPICYNCNKRGHTQYQCKARENVQHPQQPLN